MAPESTARRLRSLARYYWGWTEYYTALLTKTPQRATEAMKAFGGLRDLRRENKRIERVIEEEFERIDEEEWR